MLKYSPHVLVLATVFILTSCGQENSKTLSKNKKEEKPLFEKFYYPTAKDGKTRYYQYLETIESSGQDSYSFISTRRIERNGDTLTFVEYQHFNDTTIAVDSSINLIKSDGIHYVESHFHTGNWVKFDGIKGNLIIPWDWEKTPETIFERSISEQTSKLSGRDPMKFVSRVKLQSFGELTDAFNGKNSYAVLKGKGKYELGSSLPEFEMTYWQLEGFGLYYFEMSAPPNKYSSLAEKELTEKEYKALFK